MKYEVRYFSKGGNTKKLADAIAAAIGAEAKPTTEALTGRCELLFLGASVYAGKPNAEVVQFIQANAKNIGKIVVFGSSASGKSTHAAIKSAAAGCAVKTAEMFFSCPGKFLFMHKNRPNEKDCADAAEFARKQTKVAGVT